VRKPFLCLSGKVLVPAVAAVLCFQGCVSHLENAKAYYTGAQAKARRYDTEAAVALYKRALEEAEKEAALHPSAQAFMLKGMAAMSLELWKEAEESFLDAFSCGFDQGQEWAEWVSLLGLASTLEEMGLEAPCRKIWKHLMEKSRLRPVSEAAAQKYTDLALEETLGLPAGEREKALDRLVKEMERLVSRDFSGGFYHYLYAQVLGHAERYRESFEAAVMAKELGLPGEKISRDNDNQIVFCYRELEKSLSGRQWEAFRKTYLSWVLKWGWPGPETPAWKKR